MNKWKEEEVLTNLVVEWNREVLVYYSEQRESSHSDTQNRRGNQQVVRKEWLNVNDMKSTALKMKRNEGDSHS